MTSSLSVVLSSRNEGSWLARTVSSLEATIPEGSEILVVDDGSDDGSADFLARSRGTVRLLRTPGVGVGAARNCGARHAKQDVLVFCDAHMRFAEDWWRPMVNLLADGRAGGVAPAVGSTRVPSVFGYGMTIPSPNLVTHWLKLRKPAKPIPAPVLPGCCFMIRRKMFERIDGYDVGMLRRGDGDNEIGLRLWLLGHELWVAPDARVWHNFRKRAPYSDPLVDVIHNRLRSALIHLNPTRLAKVIRALATDRIGAQALLAAMSGQTAERRKQMLSQRTRSDDWLFDHFELRW